MILDDYRLLPQGPELVTERAGQKVGQAAGGERHDDFDHLARVRRRGFGGGSAGKWRQSQRQVKNLQTFFHPLDPPIFQFYRNIVPNWHTVSWRLCANVLTNLQLPSPCTRHRCLTCPGISAPPRPALFGFVSSICAVRWSNAASRIRGAAEHRRS